MLKTLKLKTYWMIKLVIKRKDKKKTKKKKKKIMNRKT